MVLRVWDEPISRLAQGLGIPTKTLHTWKSRDAQPEQTEDRAMNESGETTSAMRDTVVALELELEAHRESRPAMNANKETRFEFIRANAARFTVQLLCKVLDVSTSGYYAWCNRGESERDCRDRTLLEEIRGIFEESRQTYGSPRVFRELLRRGYQVSKKRVARLMRDNGLSAITPKRFKKTTLSDHDRRVAPDLLRRQFERVNLDEVWVGDITYVWTDEGWLYLGVLLDLATRKVVGWHAADHMRDELTLAALDSAVRSRGSADLGGLLHHTDRGSQYASNDYIQALRDRGMIRSMSRRGNCWDNAVAESFFATLKKELVYRTHFETRAEAILALTDYIDAFYNQQRLHSSIDYLAPATMEVLR